MGCLQKTTAELCVRSGLLCKGRGAGAEGGTMLQGQCASQQRLIVMAVPGEQDSGLGQPGSYSHPSKPAGMG